MIKFGVNMPPKYSKLETTEIFGFLSVLLGNKGFRTALNFFVFKHWGYI